jgi:hypothetical protein
MVTIKLYVEGAAQKSDAKRALCREAFGTFFEAAGIARRPRTVACGGRKQAYDAFVTAIKTAKSGELPLLLVDSEEAIADGLSNWQHLKVRDSWDRPNGALDDQVFLMVQVMETWFLADPSNLQRYFGQCFSDAALKAWPALEKVPKQTIYEVLKQATKNCGKTVTAQASNVSHTEIA